MRTAVLPQLLLQQCRAAAAIRNAVAAFLESIEKVRFAAACEQLIHSTAVREVDAAAELEQAQRVAAAHAAADSAQGRRERGGHAGGQWRK